MLRSTCLISHKSWKSNLVSSFKLEDWTVSVSVSEDKQLLDSVMREVQDRLCDYMRSCSSDSDSSLPDGPAGIPSSDCSSWRTAACLLQGSNTSCWGVLEPGVLKLIQDLCRHRTRNYKELHIRTAQNQTVTDSSLCHHFLSFIWLLWLFISS